jgi:toxin FitB
MGFLLDTNVISEVRRRVPAPGVISWFDSTRNGDHHISVLTVGELRQGVDRLRLTDPNRADPLADWLARLVSGYGDRVVPITTEIAQCWGALNVPDRMPVADGLIAATAIVNDWTLVTRNVKDFQRAPVRLLNPFDHG